MSAPLKPRRRPTDVRGPTGQIRMNLTSFLQQNCGEPHFATFFSPISGKIIQPDTKPEVKPLTTDCGLELRARDSRHRRGNGRTIFLDKFRLC